ncbi:MAG: hypothetical protein ACYDC1_02735 [Limisphaerales bacterium]
MKPSPINVAANWCSPVTFPIPWTRQRSDGSGECHFAATGEERGLPATGSIQAWRRSPGRCQAGEACASGNPTASQGARRRW